MLSDSPAKQLLPSRKDRPVVEGKNKMWSDNQKMEAVRTFIALGNAALTARILGIPEITIKKWKNTQWWQNAVEEARAEDKLELSTELKKIVKASLAVVADRLENGDFQYDQKKGELVRKPVALRDAHRVALDMQQRSDILEKHERKVTNEDSTVKKLENVAEQLARLARKINNKDAQDISFVEEVDEEVFDVSDDRSDTSDDDGVHGDVHGTSGGGD